MVTNIKNITDRLFSLIQGYLFRNGAIILSNTIMTTLFGFIFWAIVAHMYQIEEVGLIATLIASQYLITRIGMMGFDTSIVRYFPKYKEHILSTGVVLVSILTLFLSLIYSAYLVVIQDLRHGFVALYIVSTVAFISFLLLESYFLAIRKTELTLIKNSISIFLRIILAIAFAKFGSIGLFAAWTISLILPILPFITKIIAKPKFKILHEVKRFSGANYVSQLFGTSYNSTLQILITALIGATITAQFFIVYTFVSLIYFIPDAFAQSLFAEGSQSIRHLNKKIKKTILYSSLALIPVIIILGLFGRIILSIFGKDYSSVPTIAIVILAVSGIPAMVHSVYQAILRIKKSNFALIRVNATLFITIMAAFIALKGLGIIGISLSILLGYLSTNMLALYDFIK